MPSVAIGPGEDTVQSCRLKPLEERGDRGGSRSDIHKDPGLVTVL